MPQSEYSTGERTMADRAIPLEDKIGAEVLALNTMMEQLAVDGEWEQISALVSKRNALLRQVGDAARKTALEESKRSTDRIRRLAEKARQETADRLSRLQRGREATDSYRAHT